MNGRHSRNRNEVRRNSRHRQTMDILENRVDRACMLLNSKLETAKDQVDRVVEIGPDVGMQNSLNASSLKRGRRAPSGTEDIIRLRHRPLTALTIDAANDMQRDHHALVTLTRTAAPFTEITWAI